MNKYLASLQSTHLPVYLFISLVFLLNILIFWPGQWTPDSHSVYQSAQMGLYNDVHPPIMSLVWRFLLNFYSGSGLMLAFHLALLYTACIIFMNSFSYYWTRWYYVFYPLLPPVLFYSSMIWKDVSFALAFLLLSAILTYYAAYKKKLEWWATLIFAIVLFYGTAVKFQGIYVAPIIIYGLCYILNGYRYNMRTLISAILCFATLYMGIVLFNGIFVPEERKSNHWKYVKIYDIAGVSINLDKPLFPAYIMNQPQFSFEAVKKKFNYERVDDIVFFEDSPISRHESAIDRDVLLQTWFQVILRHPFSYLKHRFWNWSRIVTTKPLEKLDTFDFSKFGSLGWLDQLKQAAQSAALSWQHYLGVLIFSILSFIRYLFSFIPVFIFLCAYIVWGLSQRKQPVGVILFIINASALALVVSLFFFSMASSLRYVYLAVCLVHASHPLAYYLYFNGGRSIDKKKQIPILDIEDTTC